MGNILYLSVEILILGILLTRISFFSLIFVTIFFFAQLYFIFKTKTITYYLIPILFLIHSYFSVNFTPIHKNQNIIVKTNLVHGHGKAETIFNKYPLKNIYISTKNIADGKYILKGKVLKISNNNIFITLKTKSKEKIYPNFIESLFNEKFLSLNKYLSEDCSNLLRGTILGEKRYISKESRDKFIYSGTGHLLAISGLHMGIITGIILFILNFFKLSRRLKYLLTFSFLTLYILGINSSPSVIRAYIMVSVFILGKIFFEKNDLKKSLSFALIITLLLYPTSCNNVSFIFSYMCLFAILYIFPQWEIKDDKLKHKNLFNLLILSGIIQVFIAPVSFYFFGTLPAFSYFTNIFVTVIGSIFTAIGAFSFIVPTFIFRFTMAPLLEKIYFLLEKVLDFCFNLPWLLIETENKPSLNFITFIYIILIVIFYEKKIKAIIRRKNNVKQNNRIY